MSDRKPLQTDSIQDLARFWDTHDLTEFEEELEEVIEPVFERETVVRIHLTSQEAEAVEQIAKAKGMDSAGLIREWVVDKVHSS